MATIDIFQRLRERLATGPAVSAIGIDLGTTKSCAAVATFNPATGQIDCACIEYPEPGVPGRPVAVPSVVAVKDGTVSVGHAAKRLVGRKGYTPLRNVFRETKNDIGLRFSYWKAPEGFQSASEIAGHLLGYMIDGGKTSERGLTPPCVVTVPASFQGAQRTATIAAMNHHTSAPDRVKLLDEPYAAFLDLLHRQPEIVAPVLAKDANVLVFDFGGGTCDVAIFTMAGADAALAPQLRATSRYHRIGGGDIDRAIVHEHLIPLLLERHGLAKTAFDWQTKRSKLEPQLLPLAERLKLALCRRIAEREVASDAGTEDIEVVAADEYEIQVNDACYFLESPTLTGTVFAKILEPYLDPQPAPETNDEYVQRGSIFSPILHALFRAKLEAEDIQAIVLAGSSTLIPQVRAALRHRFAEAQLLTWPDGNELQGAIARGAALQALSLAAFGEPLIAPVASGALGIQTRQGFLPLVAVGSSVPLSSLAPVLLHAPEDSLHRPLDLSVEVLVDGNRALGHSLWTLPAPVHAGEPLAMSWSLDDNQCLSLELQRTDDDDTEPFRQRFDAPIAHLDLGQLLRCRMLEREEAIRNDRVPEPDLGEAFIGIARDAASLGEPEKALHFVALAMQHRGATPYHLNLKGLYSERVGDKRGAETSYIKSGNSAARFNLAVLQYDQKRYDEALATIDGAIEMDSGRAYAVLKAQIVESLGRPQEARLLYQDALHGQLNLEQKEAWELHWLAKAARNLKSDEHQTAIETEMATLRERQQPALRHGYLPDQASPSPAKGTMPEGKAA